MVTVFWFPCRRTKQILVLPTEEFPFERKIIVLEKKTGDEMYNV